MTITRILYFLVSFNVFWNVIQANQPDGYLGCFEDSGGNSLIKSSRYIYNNYSNKGDMCKAECKKQNKRYAGTKGPFCYCGSGVYLTKKRNNSWECNLSCPGNPSEKCGRCNGWISCNYDRISIYDTWFCITSPCQNGATCTDISAESYHCACIVGWTGRVCNETVTTTTTTIFSSSSTQHIESSTAAQTVATTTTIIFTSTQATGSSTAAQTITTIATTIFSSSSTQPIESSTAAQTVTNTTYTISPSSIAQAIGSSTVVAQPEGNKLAIYISVPVSIVVIIVFALIITVLIIRKRLSRNKDGQKAVYQTSTNTSRSLIAVANNSYNDHDIIPLEPPVNVHATEDAATGDSEHSYYTLEQTGDGISYYNNADQRSGSAIQNNDNGYGHLHVRSTALCDPTYSHTTTTGSQVTTDHTYSHMDQSAGNKNHEVMRNVDHDIYNACNMKGDIGKLRPAMEINDVDDTYNRLAISGKATDIGEKHAVSNVNEPDYDHTDVKTH